MMQNSGIVGVDIGSWTFKICAFTNKHLEILTNETSSTETPSLISFHQSQRLVGQEAQIKLKSNYMNTVRAPLRLIGLEKSYELVEEELKCWPVKYELGNELTFSIQLNTDTKSRLQPEHFLVALISKIHKIVSSHKLNPQGYFLAIPSYLSHYQRKIIKRCGEIALNCEKVTLIDDWLSLASEYVYHRVDDLKNNTRVVIFADIGYSKCSFYVIQFTPKETRLLDCEHIPFGGSKNMDYLLTQFYDKLLKEERSQHESIFNSQKALVKMVDSIEKQRKMLSVNQDSPLQIQSLYQDYDLNYKMKRGELEYIIAPVLKKIRRSFNNVKDRMPSRMKVFSVQLVGGTSRMPYISTMIKDVFGIEPSRTLNLSQATARGATIYGTVSSHIIPLSYTLKNVNLIDICIGWHSTPYNDDFFGENQSQYTNKRTIFSANTKVPSQTFIDLPASGPVELYIYYNGTISTKRIGYLRFSTPNRVSFKIDYNKIVSSYLQRGSFTMMKMQEKKEDKWEEINLWHEDINIVEERIKIIYDLKNELESKFYEIRKELIQHMSQMSQEEQKTFRVQFKEIQDWIEKENNRPLFTSKDLEIYSNELKRIKAYQQALNILKIRKSQKERTQSEKCKGLKIRFERLREAMESIPPSSMNQYQLKKMGELVQWLMDSYSKMEQNKWEGYYLNDTFMAFAQQEFTRIVGMEL